MSNYKKEIKHQFEPNSIWFSQLHGCKSVAEDAPHVATIYTQLKVN